MKRRYSALALDAGATVASLNAGRYEIQSRRDRRVWKRKLPTLTHNINPTGHLIAACQSFGVFTNTDAEIIRGAAGHWNRQVKLMIKILKRKPSSAKHGFLEALRETEHPHIADALLGKDENLMSEFHQRILKRCRDTLVKNVIVEGELLHALISTEAITHTDAELIRTEKGHWKKQADLLVKCLLRRPDTAFNGFFKALLLCDQQHIANALLEGGLEVSVRLNLKRRRSADDDSELSSSSSESPEADEDIRSMMNRLLEEGLDNIDDLLKARRKRQKMTDADPGDLKLEYVEKLVGLLQHFTREVLSVEMGSIVIRILCLSRESVWDLREMCRSEDFLAVCRSALISKDLQTIIDVEVTLDEMSFDRCLDNLDELFPPPPSPFGAESQLPTEMLHLILHQTLVGREVGIDVQAERLSEVCETWNTVLNNDRFNRDHKRFVEASMKPYLFAPVLLETRIASSSDRPKPIIGVCILERLLYVIRAETPSIEVFNIPDISSSDLNLNIVPDHVLVRTLDVSPLEMPFNMAASSQSRCIYVTDFSQNVGCVWRVTPEGAVTKFAHNVGRPFGISISRDNYVIVVSETPNCLRVFSRFGEKVLEMPLDFEAPRQAICIEPGKFALIHGYLEPENRVVELDSSGQMLRCYGSTTGAGTTQIHWPAALIHDSRGRMLVCDRENCRVHLVQRDFRLRRHLVQQERTTVARPRRLCIDDLNGTLYVGQNDQTVKVYRIAFPCHETLRDQKDLLVKGINCFGAPKKDDGKTKQKSDGEGKTGSDESKVGSQKQKYVLPHDEYHPTENLNELPEKFLQTILLKAAALHQGPRKAQQRNLASVCSKWKDTITVMHSTNRAALSIRVGSKKQKFVLPPGEYHRTEKLNELPVDFLTKIFLKAAALHQGPRKAQQRNMASVCSKWKNIVAVTLFTNRAASLIRERNAAAKRRMREALQSQE